MARTGVSGARSSWESVAKNLSLAALDASTSSLAAISIRWKFLWAVKSRNTKTTPRTVPSASRIGAPLSSIGTSLPSFRIKSV